VCRSYSDLNFGVTFFGTQCRCVNEEALYKSTFTFTFTYQCVIYNKNEFTFQLLLSQSALRQLAYFYILRVSQSITLS